MPTPPRLARLLVFLACRRDSREFILGDLEEEYTESIEPVLGSRRARRWYWHQAFATSAAALRDRVRSSGRARPPDRRGEGIVGALAYDLRFAGRALRSRPGFAALAVLTLAVGIGASTAIFSIVEGVLVRPLAYPNSEELVAARMETVHGGRNMTGPIHRSVFEDWASATTLADIAGSWRSSKILLLDDGAERLQGATVSLNLFSLLGARPLHGRIFLEDESSHQAVIVSESVFERFFGGDELRIGELVRFADEAPRVLVGVMPRSFEFPQRDTQYWVPDPRGTDQSHHFVVGRLVAGVSLESARAEMEELWSRRAGEDALLRRENSQLVVHFLQEELVGPFRRPFALLAAATALLLAIGCANVANLLLIRVEGRQQELATRRALGASAGRLLRLVSIESLVLALIGGGLGALFAVGATRLVVSQGLQDVPRHEEIAVDARALVFALGLSLLCGLLFGIAPALHSLRADPVAGLHGGRSLLTGRRPRLLFRNCLVALQLSMALVLLVGAGLLIHSFIRLVSVDEGFDPDRVLAVRLSLPNERYNGESLTAFLQEVESRLSARPGVEGVAAGRIVPYAALTPAGAPIFTDSGDGRLTDQNPIDPFERMAFPAYIFGPFFRTLGVPILRGRGFGEADRAPASPSVLINQAMAERFWPGENPVGQQFNWGFSAGPRLTVIGVVALTHDDIAVFYTPRLLFRSAGSTSLSLVLRASVPPETLIPMVREELAAIDAEIPMEVIASMETLISGSRAPRRFRTLLLTGFASVAWALALMGVHGVIAFTVARQTHEIGIRMALGATRRQVLGRVLSDGWRVISAGLAIGLLGAWASARLLQKFLFGVSATDPATYVAVTLLLAGAALVSCYLPARRASRLDPVVALRHE